MGGFPDPQDAGIICLNFYLYLEPISDLKKASPRAVVFLFLWMGGRFIRFWWCYCSIAVGVFISFFLLVFLYISTGTRKHSALRGQLEAICKDNTWSSIHSPERSYLRARASDVLNVKHLIPYRGAQLGDVSRVLLSQGGMM